MAKEQEWFKKIQFDQCNLDEESIDHEVSNDSTTDGQDSTNENSANRVVNSGVQAGEKDSEATSFTHNQAENIQKTNSVEKEPIRTKGEDPMGSAQYVRKNWAPLILTILVAYLLNGMCFDYQTGIKDSETNVTVKFTVKQLAKDSQSTSAATKIELKKILDPKNLRRRNELFRINGLPWYLIFELFKNEEEYLAMYLCEDITDIFGYPFGHWLAKVTFDLTLVNHEAKEKSKTVEFREKKLEKNAEYRCWGRKKFILISDLYDGFVKENAIDVEVRIKSMEVELLE